MLASSEDLFDCDSDVFTRHTLIRSTFKLLLFQGWQHIKMSGRCSGMNRGTMERGGRGSKKSCLILIWADIWCPQFHFHVSPSSAYFRGLWPWLSDCKSSCSEIIWAFSAHLYFGNFWDFFFFFFIMKLIYCCVCLWGCWFSVRSVECLIQKVFI